MKKILLLLFLLIIPCSVIASSESYAVMDADSGRILKSSNMYENHLIASTTKIMTISRLKKIMKDYVINFLKQEK